MNTTGMPLFSTNSRNSSRAVRRAECRARLMISGFFAWAIAFSGQAHLALFGIDVGW